MKRYVKLKNSDGKGILAGECVAESRGLGAETVPLAKIHTQKFPQVIVFFLYYSYFPYEVANLGK